MLKNLHNFIGPLYAVSLLVMIADLRQDNIANRADFQWLLRAGGMLGQGQVPSHRFNAGEKGIFWWAVTIPGLLLVASGLVLDNLVPGLGYFRADMQLAHMVHAAWRCCPVRLTCWPYLHGHGRYARRLPRHEDRLCRPGWAREHHELWYQDIKSGKIPAQRSPEGSARPQVPDLRESPLQEPVMTATPAKLLLLLACLPIPPRWPSCRRPELSPEEQAKAAETKAKAAHQAKVDGYQTCLASEKAAAHYFQDPSPRRPAPGGSARLHRPGSLFAPAPAPAAASTGATPAAAASAAAAPAAPPAPAAKTSAKKP